MNRKLKTYKLLLTVKGPVFIGSGKEISKKEYIYLPGKEVQIMNIDKIYSLCEKNRLEKSYVDFLMNGYKEPLGQWLEKKKVRPSEIEACIRYRLSNQDAQLERGKALQIMEFVKDSYGQPYVPGSSVKGMLRTILLTADILKHPQKYSEYRENITREVFGRREGKVNRRAVLSRTIRDIENKNFHTLSRTEKMADAVNDYMSGMIVSDSTPLEISDLVLCQKIEKHADGRETKLNLLRECLKPGTVIECDLTIDTSICKITVEDMQHAIELFEEMYEDNFLFKYKTMDKLTADSVYLGGGAGFVSKTIIYALFQKTEGIKMIQNIFEKTGVPKVHKHGQDLKYGVSPHILKCTHYRGKTVQMGLCTCKIQEKS